MKRLFKAIVVAKLGKQVRKLQSKNSFVTIGVVGSYGKTSSKMAIAQLLETEFHVRYQKGNYNDVVSVPLIFFDQKLPSLFNPLAWLGVFWRNSRILKREYPYDVVVVELGTDGPGQIGEFSKYLKLDYAVVTALGPEHMENFKDVADVAKEELSVQNYSDTLIINKDLCAKELLRKVRGNVEYYSLEFSPKFPLDSWRIRFDDDDTVRLQEQVLSRARLYSLSTATVMGLKMKIDLDKIQSAINEGKILSVPGRMNTLKGKKGSVIIDDTYNASPEATILALETLYSYPVKQRIALLGSMNELGKYSADLHKQVGKECTPNKLDLLVTLGDEANKYLATAAEKNGCKVIRTTSPYDAAEKIEENLKNDSVILAKGSQNGVFAEEAVRLLLDDPTHTRYLVRQGHSWQSKKQDSFQIPWEK